MLHDLCHKHESIMGHELIHQIHISICEKSIFLYLVLSIIDEKYIMSLCINYH